MNDWPPEVKEAIDRAMGNEPTLVTGDFMVAWAKQNVRKSCALCHGERYFEGRRAGKPIREVCGCAAKRFMDAFRVKVEQRGSQLAWRKGFIPAPEAPAG